MAVIFVSERSWEMKRVVKFKIDELRNDQLKIIAERENITKQSLVEKIINNYIDQRLLNDHLPELVDQLSKIDTQLQSNGRTIRQFINLQQATIDYLRSFTEEPE